MRHLCILCLWLVMVVVPAAAQDAVPPDSVPPSARAPGEDLLLRLGLKPMGSLFDIRFDPPPALDVFRPLPQGRRTAEWTAGVRARIAAQQAAAWRAGHRDAAQIVATDTVAYLPPEPGRRSGEDDLLPGAVSEYADLQMAIVGRGEFGGSWMRVRPCDPGIAFADCNPSLIPHLKPDLQFGIRVGGTIQDRVHVNVDYDQRREFDAANNINVYYQGLEDEILQRLEVGDVSIALPSSRYVTEGIPTGNFGFKAAGQVGPIEFEGVWAQQKGDMSTREFQLGGAGVEGFVQDQTLILDDANYVRGQFFFLVDPAEIAGAPHIDILALRSGDAPPAVRPEVGSLIEVYRDERRSLQNIEQQGQLGYFQAMATVPGEETSHSGRFRRLIPGEDYTVHQSGLWIALRSPLRTDEALAISFRTETGEVVGTLNADAQTGTVPEVRLLRGPDAMHQPGFPTWDFEMKQVYRMDASSGVDRGSVELTISLGDLTGGLTYREHAGEQVTLLKLFGLDEESPAEQVDRVRIFQPRADEFDTSASGMLGGTFIVFPTLRPFASPPPVESRGMNAEMTAQILGADANATIYDNPDPLMRQSAGRFRLNLAYRVRMEGLVSSFNLGAFGIRDGSERLMVDGQILERGIDYDIDYEIGQVTLMNPQAIFGMRPDASVRVTYEQHALFQIAPTTVFGAHARYGLGQRGQLNFMGMYQGEKSIMARPQLGVEPASIFIGGASGDVSLGARWLDRLLDRMPGLQLGDTSSVRLTGEMAMSLPNPNTRGDTYIDDFEATEEMNVGLDRRAWRLGSRPSNPLGATDVLPSLLNVESAGRLVWQHDYRDSNNTLRGAVDPHQIDQQINVAGFHTREPVLYITFGEPDDPPGERRWRSITSVLSTTGRDMTRSEYLEFYVDSESDDMALILDLGTVSNDAFYFNAQGETSGVYPDGTPWGLGVLDQEVNLAAGELWSPMHDERGLWNQDCRADPHGVYPLGDLRSNCTRGNGLFDTEDLDGSSVLQQDDGQLFRYVVRLDRNSPFLVRDTDQTATTFRLYRIPLRGAHTTALNGANPATWRTIKHMRMTVTGSAGGQELLILGRMRIIGSRWLKRAGEGVVSGRTGDEAGISMARVEAGPVSRITDGSAYNSPPGVLDELQDPTSSFAARGVEFNEKGLRIRYEALGSEERAEIFTRYLQQPRDFLDYRRIRLWAVPRAGDWGPDGTQELHIKIGSDPRNYYVYRTRLRPAVTGSVVAENDWRPEILIDFEPWMELKVRAEEVIIAGGLNGESDVGEPLVLWSADSTYGIVLEDRARAPNLRSVREISAAVYNADGIPSDGEVWLNDIRLDEGARDPGFAGHLDLQIRGGDFTSANISYARQGSFFRQLNTGANYQQSGDLSVSTTTQLGRLMPTGWGVDMPVSASYVRSAADPLFLDRTDVRADRFENLRNTGADRRRLGVSLQRRASSDNRLLNLFVDPTSVRLGYTRASTSSITSVSEVRSFDGAMNYGRQLRERSFGAVPGVVGSVLEAVAPGWLQRSDAFQRMLGSRMRWSPESLTFNNSYLQQQTEATRFDQILVSDADTAIRPIETERQGLEQTGRVAFRPFDNMTASVNVTSSRDLLDPEKATTRPHEREALQAARGRFAGLDMGWERQRTMQTQLTFRPAITDWLSPGFTYSGRFTTGRNPSHVDTTGTMAVLQNTFRANRNIGRTLQLDPARFVQSTVAAPGDTGRTRDFALMLGRTIQPIELRWDNTLNSRYDRETAQPGLGYQFALGGIDDVRVMDGDTAASAGTSAAFSVGSALNLPASVQLGFAFGNSESRNFEPGSQQTSKTRAWPDLQLRFNNVPIPQSLRLYLPRATVSTGYRLSKGTSVLAGQANSMHGSSRDYNIPLQIQLALIGGFNGSYSGSLRRSRAEQPMGSSRTEAVTHALQLTGRFRAPEGLQNTFENPIQTAIRYSQQDSRQCRVQLQPGEEVETCVTNEDRVNRRLELSMDTNISQLNVGFRLSYNDRQNRVGDRRGSSQFQIGLFGNFNISAGSLGPGGR